jgi:hypothetical protein
MEINMSTLTIHPKDAAQEKAIRAIFDAFSIKYEKEMDETEYLMSTEANRKNLDESIQQLEDGKGVKITLEDLWK